MEIEAYLHTMVKHNASDLFFSAGAPAGIKIQGETRRLGKDKLSSQDVRKLAYSLLNDKQIASFEAEMELNLAIALESLGRFRVNMFRQRGSVAMVIRYIKSEIPSIESLNLPPILKDLIMEPRGLILVVGATGSGKSTTLASMIDHRNENKTGHILTIEEPIEFLHQHKKSIVDQRELGLDTLSYANALKNAMREAPDVILIGEIRDRETMKHAISYAETGHLCLSTLHANNANQTLDRIINFFPESAHHQLFIDLSEHLRAIISQRLVPSTDGKRVPAVEVLIRTPYVADLILKNDIDSIKEAMKEGGQAGMQTFDQALLKLYKEGRITEEQALEHADSRNDLGLAIRTSRSRSADDAPEGLSIDRFD
ncbi:PilT/PilU family type 4a pilus ATPase [Wenzhouxiangella sediminis]|uniref:PilT/PilU family type 4a pilus ATPase n=1 Tax=Wenzhouxiangella sediminis TaxID=1792836 RepID=A0A3E1K5R0_9GAMM|nr:PilT/PilU family type 4a pilus ATPase [Wenzhouxiangella sediminis]RFF29373.1 PilT/PilU family type 4a pilus ATPase [Wenzhouxiangella sediminis]